MRTLKYYNLTNGKTIYHLGFGLLKLSFNQLGRYSYFNKINTLSYDSFKYFHIIMTKA